MDNNLDPKIKRERWTPEEYKIIFEKYHKWGPKWAMIAKLPSRSEN